jgi:hypothetical protein
MVNKIKDLILFHTKRRHGLQDTEILPLRVICATQHSMDDFFSKTLTGVTLEKFSDVTPAQVIVHTENKVGLSTLYNQAIEEAAQSPCILVFMHEYLEILDFFWGDRIRKGLQAFDIVGLAGNTRRSPLQPSWYFREIKDDHVTADEPEFLSGAVGHFDEENGNPLISHYGEIERKCKLLDGLLVAAESETLIKSNTRFDDQFSFHFYDMDFCRSAEVNGLSMGTIGLAVNHKSMGSYDQTWLDANDRYISKWKE